MFHKVGVYDAFHNVAEAKRHYKRCRTLKCFKLDKDAVKKTDPVCSHCGKKFSEHERTANADGPESMQFQIAESEMLANHCWYNPRTGKVIIMQYHCSWTSAFEQIFNNKNRVY